MMTLKQLFVTGWWSEKHQSNVRPLWQIVAFAPLYALYLPARAFVSWMDGR
jgi:hypothetical protein